MTKFATKEERNKWYREYREKNRERVRAYNRKYMQKLRMHNRGMINAWKARYRHKNKDEINAYKRQYRAQGLRPLNKERRLKILALFDNKCFRCGTAEKLNVHHHKPLRLGGTNKPENLMVFCWSCHMKYHQFFSNDFWNLNLIKPYKSLKVK
jgi:5-methylcytosine-specific restriction endonuclease McrA